MPLTVHFRRIQPLHCPYPEHALRAALREECIGIPKLYRSGADGIPSRHRLETAPKTMGNDRSNGGGN